MKTLKSIAAVSILAAGITSVASAYTPTASTDHIYIVGAPAYRAESIATLDHIVKVVFASKGGGEIASSSATSDYSNTNNVVWVIPGYTTGRDLEINASFSGSTAGVESVLSTSGSFPQTFINDTNTGTVASPTNNLTSSNTTYVSYQAQASLSDTFLATTPFIGTVSLETAATPAKNAGDHQFNNFSFASTTPTQVGVEEYHWVGTHGLAARGVTNITTAQAQLLYKFGQLPLSYFTGNHSDETSYVYPLTRDSGSGARLIALAETGVGVTTPIVTYKPTISGGAADTLGNVVGGSITDGVYNPNTGVGGPNEYPAGQIASTLLWDDNVGDTGYPKFGTTDTTGLLAAITSLPTDTNAFYITYLDSSDAAEAESPTAVQPNNKTPAEELTYNGLAAGGIVAATGAPNYTAQRAAVAEGQYTFWSVEQLYQSSGVVSGTPQATFIAQIISNFPSFANIPLTALQVSRSVDGGPISHNF